jgi:hypothetical protein
MIRRLVPPVLRTTPLLGFIPAGVLAVVMGLVAGQQPIGPEFRFLPSRLAILSIVIAAGFIFDDPATPITDPAPNPLRLRRLIRSAAALLIVTVLFTSVMFIAADDMSLVAVIDTNTATTFDPELDPSTELPEFPWGRLALEMATMIGFVLAAAAAINRRGESQPGRIATGVLLAGYAISWMIPESHQAWANPTDQRWETGANWWWLALTLAWFSVAVLSWDSRVGWRLAQFRHRSGAIRDCNRISPDTTPSG